jgi:hypothetical protein
MKIPNRREATEKMMSRNLPTSRQVLPNLFMQNLMRKKAVMGIVIIKISARDRGNTFVSIASVPLKIEEIFLLKKSAKLVFAIAIMYRTSERAQNPKKK